MSADDGLRIGRRVKARRIAAAIRRMNGSAADARWLTDSEWMLADLLSRRKDPSQPVVILATHRPPSPDTRALVIEYLSRPDDTPRDKDDPGPKR